MIINGSSLLVASPIKDMIPKKQRGNKTSFGLSEAGYDIRIAQTILLNDMTRFILASAIEEFQMPTNLVGFVHDKSTWARRGVSLFNTVIEPGWKGFLTLEIAYFGNEDVWIMEGEGIAQVIFHEVCNKASYEGKYQFQPNYPVGAIDG